MRKKGDLEHNEARRLEDAPLLERAMPRTETAAAPGLSRHAASLAERSGFPDGVSSRCRAGAG